MVSIKVSCPEELLMKSIGELLTSLLMSILIGAPIGAAIFFVYGFVGAYAQPDKYDYFAFTWMNFFVCMSIGVGGTFVTELISESNERHKTERAEEERVQRETKEAEDRREEEIRRRAWQIRRVVDDSSAEFVALPGFLADALESANVAHAHWKAGVYSPFWSAIEESFASLGLYYESIGNLDGLAKQYEVVVRDYRNVGGHDVVPVFPVTVDAAKVASQARPVADKIRDLSYAAQKDPHYAMVWEQRRTTTATVKGFATLERAISQMGSRIAAGTADLAAQIDSLSGAVRSSSATITGAVNAQTAAHESTAAAMDGRVREAVQLLERQERRARGLIW